jgi:26S proteasome non-ATPase regulatory subunit 9
VRSVRLARTQIICLQNDLKSLLKVIDDGLQKYFYDRKDVPEASSSKLPPQMKRMSIDEDLRPFLVVNLVTPNSPGDVCGVQVHDLILSFGSININNFKDLQQIGELVKNCQNQQVKINIRRNTSHVELILVPKIWNGQGLLGFKVAAIPH